MVVQSLLSVDLPKVYSAGSVDNPCWADRIIMPLLRSCHSETAERLDKPSRCIKDPHDLLVRPADESQRSDPRRIGHVVSMDLRSSDLCPNAGRRR